MSFILIIFAFDKIPCLVDQKAKYLWSKDEVQTARVLFYLRVIPTFVECLPSLVFSNMIAPTMFLYPISTNYMFGFACFSQKIAFQPNVLTAAFSL